MIYHLNDPSEWHDVPIGSLLMVCECEADEIEHRKRNRIATGVELWKKVRNYTEEELEETRKNQFYICKDHVNEPIAKFKVINDK